MLIKSGPTKKPIGSELSSLIYLLNKRKNKLNRQAFTGYDHLKYKDNRTYPKKTIDKTK